MYSKILRRVRFNLVKLEAFEFFSVAGLHKKCFLLLLHITNYINSPWKLKKSTICFKLFWYKGCFHWKLKQLNFSNGFRLKFLPLFSVNSMALRNRVISAESRKYKIWMVNGKTVWDSWHLYLDSWWGDIPLIINMSKSVKCFSKTDFSGVWKYKIS